MKGTIDPNVVLDVVQKRQPHYIVDHFAGREKAAELIDWLIHHFEVAEAVRDELVHARKLAFPDFEDAVVAACAVQAGSDLVITRNISDFQL